MYLLLKNEINFIIYHNQRRTLFLISFPNICRTHNTHYSGGGAGAGVNLSRNTERCCGADPISNLTFLSYTFAITTTHAATELQLGSGPGEE